MSAPDQSTTSGRLNATYHDALASRGLEFLPLDLARGATDTGGGEAGTANERVGAVHPDFDPEYEGRPLTLASSTRVRRKSEATLERESQQPIPSGNRMFVRC